MQLHRSVVYTRMFFCMLCVDVLKYTRDLLRAYMQILQNAAHVRSFAWCVSHAYIYVNIAEYTRMIFCVSVIHVLNLLRA